MILTILFWLLLLLCAIGVFVPDGASPYIGRSRWVIVLILITILGFKVLDNPLTK